MSRKRTMVITGTRKGIGKYLVDYYIQQGYMIFGCSREPADYSYDDYQHFCLDVSDEQKVKEMCSEISKTHNCLDVVINNAAIGVRDRALDLQEKQARRIMDVNYFGPVALIRAAIPHLRSNPDGGLIVNISSIVGRRAMPGIGGYCASKAALEKMAESLRLELLADDIRVSTVYPGVTATDFNDNSLGNSQSGRGRVSGVPPERVARAILHTIRHEQRDVFITLFDRAFVAASSTR